MAAARQFLKDMVDPDRFKNLVQDIPESVYSKYSRLSSEAVQPAVEDFLSSLA